MLILLSIATGLIFVFLLVSLVVSALNELVFSFFDQRAAFLKEGLNQLLGNHPETLRQFLEHGLIDACSRKTGGAPSYVPTNMFVTALLDVVAPARPDPAHPSSVRQAVDIARVLTQAGEQGLAHVNPKLAQSLRALYDEAGGDVQRFRLGIGRWFDQSADRVGGWYKRRVQQCLFVLALGIAVVGNVDSIHIVQGLSADPRLRESVAQAAADSVKQRGNVGAPAVDGVNALAKQLNDSITQLNGLSLPIGWGDAQCQYFFRDPQLEGVVDHRWNRSHLLTALAGWVMTALAASLGAPFWFDMLQKVVTIRGAGRTPAEAEKAIVAKAASVVEAVTPAIAAATPLVDAHRETVVLPPAPGGGR